MHTRGEKVKKSEKFADVICTCLHIVIGHFSRPDKHVYLLPDLYCIGMSSFTYSIDRKSISNLFQQTCEYGSPNTLSPLEFL